MKREEDGIRWGGWKWMEVVSRHPLITALASQSNILEARCSSACIFHMNISPLLLQWHYGLHVHTNNT